MWLIPRGEKVGKKSLTERYSWNFKTTCLLQFRNSVCFTNPMSYILSIVIKGLKVTSFLKYTNGFPVCG